MRIIFFIVIKILNWNISHRWNKLSIRMIKVCDKTLVYPLKRFLKVLFQEGVLPVSWTKKQSKNFLKNYRPISLLPSFGKIYERVIFEEIFDNFHQNQLFTICQSGFLSGGLCISQYCLDISKDFVKAWGNSI